MHTYTHSHIHTFKGLLVLLVNSTSTITSLLVQLRSVKPVRAPLLDLLLYSCLLGTGDNYPALLLLLLLLQILVIIILLLATVPVTKLY
jgi:hypothetical protein